MVKAMRKSFSSKQDPTRRTNPCKCPQSVKFNPQVQQNMIFDDLGRIGKTRRHRQIFCVNRQYNIQSGTVTFFLCFCIIECYDHAYQVLACWYVLFHVPLYWYCIWLHICPSAIQEEVQYYSQTQQATLGVIYKLNFRLNYRLPVAIQLSFAASDPQPIHNVLFLIFPFLFCFAGWWVWGGRQACCLSCSGQRVVLMVHLMVILQVIARRLLESKQNTPHLYLSSGFDALWSTILLFM